MHLPRRDAPRRCPDVEIRNAGNAIWLASKRRGALKHEPENDYVRSQIQSSAQMTLVLYAGWELVEQPPRERPLNTSSWEIALGINTTQRT